MGRCKRIGCKNDCKYHHLSEGSTCLKTEHTRKCRLEKKGIRTRGFN